MRALPFLIIFLSVLLFSCSSNDDKSEELKAAKLVSFDETMALKKNWSIDVGSGQDKRFAKLTPAVQDGIIYASDVDGKILAYDYKNRKRLWKVDIKKDISASVGVFGALISVGTYDGEVIAIDATNGEVLWQSQASSEILGVPVVSRNAVVVQTIDGRLFAYSSKNGESLWRYDHTVPALTIRGTADPVISRNQVIAAFGNGQLVSLNLSDGSLQWSARVSQPKGRTELEKMVDIDGTPIVSGGLVYAATYHGAIAAMSKAQGQVIWKADASTFNSLAVTSSQVFVVDERSHVIAFDSASGAVDWKNDQLHRRGLRAPVAFDRYIAAIDDDGHLHVLNQNDGAFAYRFKPSGKKFLSAPLAYEEGILLLSGNGTLSSYRVDED